MSKLKWDQAGEKTYETGIRQGVLYPIGTGTEAGTYPKGVAWNGLSSVQESPSGAEAEAIYADDIKYLSLTSVEEFGGTIEAYTYPVEWEECDGSAELAPGVTIGQQPRKVFGLCYRTVLGNDTEKENYGYKLHLVYGAQANPSDKQYQSMNDSPEANAFSWEFTTTPVPVDLINPKTGKMFNPTASLVFDSTKTDKAKMEAIEEILYGTDSADPRLPLPEEVYSIMTKGATSGSGSTGAGSGSSSGDGASLP